MRNKIRRNVRSIAITTIAPVIGFLLITLGGLILKFELTKLTEAVINLFIVSFIALIVFPRWLGIPFGKVDTRTFLRKTGFYLPPQAWKHFVLGLIMAVCTLSGMLIASVLTGKYTMELSNINLPHLVFSLNPALWEELFYRGVLIIVLLKVTRSLKKAFIIQVVLFGLMHVKGTDLLAFVDVISVMVLAVGFTYIAYQTRSLTAGIIFHYFHDAFLKIVQLPSGIATSTAEKVLFYVILWSMVGVGCVVTKNAAEKFGVRSPAEIYVLENN